MHFKIKKRLLIILLTLIYISPFCAQEVDKISKKEAKAILETAEQQYEEMKYLDALQNFTKLYNAYPTDVYYKFMMGICLTFDPNQKQKTIEIFEEIKIINPDYNLLNFYLGKAYAINYKFDEALTYFKKYNENANNTKEYVLLTNKMISNVENAKKILSDTIKENFVENIGVPINTNYSEYVPVISTDESIMIFTYRGIKSKSKEKALLSSSAESYNEDVFISYKIDNVWTEPISIGDNINTNGHDAAIGLSADGQTLFIYKSENNNQGDIYESHLEGDNWSKPTPIIGEVNKNNSWEGSASLSSNGKILYFSSDRKGGIGGRDLYRASLKKDGSWGNIVNLGSEINTIYNEDAPFIHPDEKTLFFSSQGHSSIGGYDVFSTTIKDSLKFSSPINLGFPINTIYDNRYFVLAADGKTGYYSGGGEESYGGQDIFKIGWKIIKNPILALIKGNVYLNDTPIGSTISLYDKKSGALEGEFKSNKESGKYIMTISPGVYEIEVKLATGNVLKDSIRLDITEYVEVNKEFRFYSDSNLTVENNKTLQETLNIALNKSTNDDDIDTLFSNNANILKDMKELKKKKPFILHNILYDFDKATLRPESQVELDRLVVILNENLLTKIEISSHTDSRGSDSYNLKLSQKRANSVVNYLISKGIPKARLVPVGKGETNPLEDCSKYNECGITRYDECPCHQANRRTEFKVLSN